MYDISRDGRRFLIIEASTSATPEGPASRMEVTLVQNWFEELNRRVPPR